MVLTPDEIRDKILERLNGLYEEKFKESIDANDFCVAFSLSLEQLEVVIAPLLASSWVEKAQQSLTSYALRLTEFGKLQLDQQTGNAENERIREVILDVLSGEYEKNPYEFVNSESLVPRLGIDWNKLVFNLKILEMSGYVRLDPYMGAGHPAYYVSLTPEGKTAHDNPSPEILFLSHAAVDDQIAKYLKQVIEKTFPRVNVFVSSDAEDLPPGDPWVDTILRNLHVAKMLLVLATERGLSRRWVWFETGAGWSKELRIVPCCIGRVEKGQLPPPFSSYQAVKIDLENDLKNLFDVLSRLWGATAQSLDLPKIVSELVRLEQKAMNAMPSEENIRQRVEAAEVSGSIRQGLASNFIIEVKNDSNEEVIVKEIQLQSENGIRLTDPAKPPSPGLWKIQPGNRQPIDWRAQDDPAVKLITLNQSGGERELQTSMRIILVCEILGKIKRCDSKVWVQVDVLNRWIRQVAP